MCVSVYCCSTSRYFIIAVRNIGRFENGEEKRVNCRTHCHTYIGVLHTTAAAAVASIPHIGRVVTGQFLKNVNKSASDDYNIVPKYFMYITLYSSCRPITHNIIQCDCEEEKNGAQDMCLGSFYLPFECRARRFFFLKNCHSI